MIYFDNAATTKTSKIVLNSMMPYFNDEYGNPSTLYKLGYEANKAIFESRSKFAKSFNCEPSQIYFTSGGSEGDSWIIRGVIGKYIGFHKCNMITSKIEHHAVLNTCKLVEEFGCGVKYVNVDNNGVVDINEIENSIDNNTVLISIMYVNNEIGSIQPIKKIVEIAHKHNILVHTDAVQAVGHLKIDVKDLGVDFLTVSCHKFYAPKGIGVCYVKDKSTLCQLISGGKQENGMRGGTENVPYIVGAGCAIEYMTNNFSKNIEYLDYLSNIFFSELKNSIDNFTINGSLKNKISSTFNISFDGVDGEILQLELAKRSICVSNGSACNSGNKQPSHVLTAMGVDKNKALNSIRISIGLNNSINDIDILIKSLKDIILKLKR